MEIDFLSEATKIVDQYIRESNQEFDEASYKTIKTVAFIAMAEGYSMAKNLQPCASVVRDNVNHPQHYNQGGLECLDVIKAMLGPKDVNAEYSGTQTSNIANVMKYVFRHRFKGKPLEDLKKAHFYLERVIAETECDN